MDDIQSLCRTLISSKNRPHQSVSEAWLHRNADNFNKIIGNNTATNAAIKTQLPASRSKSKEQQSNYVSQKVPGAPQEQKTSGVEANFVAHDIADHREQDTDNVIEIRGIEENDAALSSGHMAFMKSLVDQNSKFILRFLITLKSIKKCVLGPLSNKICNIENIIYKFKL